MGPSPHFTWDEVTRSPTARRLGIDNSLPPNLAKNAAYTAAHMETVRHLLVGPISPNSWYRSLALNAAVGGKPTSAHLKALAVDFDPPAHLTLEGGFEILARSSIPFDQLIIEGTRDGAQWIHIGFTLGVPRRDVLRGYGLKLGGDMTFRRVAVG